MKDGDLVRVRNIRTYGADPRNYFEWRPDNEKARDLKRVFVCLVLGTEGYELVNRKGEQVMAPLDVHRALNRLGWWSEAQILESSGPKAGPKLIDKMAKTEARKKENRRQEAQKKAKEG